MPANQNECENGVHLGAWVCVLLCGGYLFIQLKIQRIIRGEYVAKLTKATADELMLRFRHAQSRFSSVTSTVKFVQVYLDSCFQVHSCLLSDLGSFFSFFLSFLEIDLHSHDPEGDGISQRGDLFRVSHSFLQQPPNKQMNNQSIGN